MPLIFIRKFVLVNIFLFLYFLIIPQNIFAISFEFPAKEFTFTKTGPTNTNPGPVISRAGTYDSAPSAIQEGDVVKIWYCGSESDRNSLYRGHDQIYYSAYNVYTGAIITPPMPVLWPTLNDKHDDGDMACAVAVAKHKNPGIYGNGSWGGENYKMWYECAPITYRKEDNQIQGSFTQICHAVSDDGITWYKWEDLSESGGLWRYNTQSRDPIYNTKATSVIKIPALIKANIQYERRDGRFFAYYGDYTSASNLGANNVALNYGVGHPSVVVSPPNQQGYQKIQLWYYDSQGAWDKRALMYVESYDGFNFTVPIKTNFQSPYKIKYINLPFGLKYGVYISTGGGFHKSFFNYSWDGLDWFWQDHGSVEYYTNDLVRHFNLGTATNCSDFGNGMVSNPYGVMSSLTNIRIISTEGGLGPYDGCKNDGTCPCYNKVEDDLYCFDDNTYKSLDQACIKRGSRGDAWDLYSIIGNFTYTPKDLNFDRIVTDYDARLMTQYIFNRKFYLVDLVKLLSFIN